MTRGAEGSVGGELAEAAEDDPSVALALDQALGSLVSILAAAVSVLDPEAVLLATNHQGFSALL